MNQALIDRFEDLMESDLNDPEVQYQIGLCYQNGEGTEQSGAEAEKWFHRAAEQGHQGAQALLSAGREQAEELGEITGDNLPDWCLRAEKPDDTEAQYQVGRYFLEHPELGGQEEGEEYLKRAEDGGKFEASLLLGKLMLKRPGQEAEAIHKLKNAADGNRLPEAAFLLGRCYMEGTGVEQNSEEAARYLELGAEAGGAEAMIEIAAQYTVGMGLPAMPGRGRSWLARAQRLGLADAKQRYDLRCAQLTQEKEELQRAEETRRAEEAKRIEEARQAEEARRAEEAKRIEEARQAEEARHAEEAKQQAARKGRFGRFLILLGLWMPLEFMAVTTAMVLNYFLDIGTSFDGLPAFIKWSFVLLPFVPSLLAAGSHVLRRNGVREWYRGLSGEAVATTGNQLFYVSFLFFEIMIIIVDGLGLLGIIVLTVLLMIALGLLWLVNQLVMAVLGINDTKR